MQIHHFLPFLLCSVNLIFNKLFCNSSSSTGQLCITFFCHSALLLFCLSFCSASALHFISLYAFASFLAMPLLIFFFLLFTHFSFRNNQLNTVCFNFFYALEQTIQLPISFGKNHDNCPCN
jgi:hypothetical protein